MSAQVRVFRPAVLLCFFLSGSTSLVLEVVWTRSLGTVFGNTVLASSVVLTAFMLGLALGSAAFGRAADGCRRLLVLYGGLELGVGLYAFAFPLLTAGCGQFYGWFYRACAPGPWLLNSVRLALSLAMLLPPTLLMGGTLPVLGRYLGASPGQGEVGREVGYLYGANTLGAVAGSLTAGLVLLEAFGVNGSLFTAGGAALLVGLIALGLGCHATGRIPERPICGKQLTARAVSQAGMPASAGGLRGENPEVSNRTLLLVAFAVTGFCALACEVLWTRVLIFLVTSTVYAFAVMLTTFLAGMALGTFCSSRWLVPRLKRPLLGFGILEVLVGLALLLSLFLLGRLESIDGQWIQRLVPGGRWRFLAVFFADAAVIELLPTFLMGVAFPVITTCLLRGEPALGKRLGRAYAANTLGCVLGSLAAGFALLPAMGTHRALLIVVALNLGVGLVLIGRAGRASPAGRWGLLLPAAALVALAFAFTPPDIFYEVLNTAHAPSRIRFLKEHATGTVTVHDLPNGDRLVAVNGVDVAGLNFMLRSTQKLQGYIPLCLHPNPRRVAQIGFGSGETARVGMEFGVESYTVVEICPAIFEAGRFFEAINHGSYRDPRIRRVIMDGKNFARLSGEHFDIVMNDSVFPGSSGSSALYTYDHFRNCRERLAEGGLFSCWVPLDLRPNELRMILRSFQEVFPHTSFWVASNCLNKHGLILGSKEPLQIDFARVRQVLERPAVKADLAAISLQNAYDFLSCMMCDEQSLRSLVAGAPFNTDDRPRLEFSCARPSSWKVRLLQSLAMLTAHRAPVASWITDLPQPEADRGELARRFESATHIFRAQVAELAGAPKVRRQEMELAAQAFAGNPAIASCEAELSKDIQDLQQVLAAHPGNATLATRLADKLYVALRHEEAALLYEALIRRQPPPPEAAFLNLAEIRFGAADPSGAEQVLLQCLASWPRSAAAHDLLGGLYLRVGRAVDALYHIEQAVGLEPGNQLYARHYAGIKEANNARQ